jgi:hypothetical protein
LHDIELRSFFSILTFYKIIFLKSSGTNFISSADPFGHVKHIGAILKWEHLGVTHSLTPWHTSTRLLTDVALRGPIRVRAGGTTSHVRVGGTMKWVSEKSPR